MNAHTPIRYSVNVSDWSPSAGFTDRFTVPNLSLGAAWRKVTRFARRGVKLYGGETRRDNWGMTGGRFPQSYRRAVITLSR